MSIWSRLLDVILWLFEQVVPVATVVRTEFTYKRRIASAELAAGPPGSHLQYRVLDIARVRDAHRLEVQRRDQFTRKAQGYLMGLTVMSSFSLGAIALTIRASSVPEARHLGGHWAFAAGLLATIVSFSMAAFSALRAVAPSRVFDVYLDNFLDGPTPIDEASEKLLFLKMIALNQAYNLILAACVKACYIAMRNGLLLLAALLVWLVLGYVGG